MYMKMIKNIYELQHWMLYGDYSSKEYDNGICMFMCDSRRDTQVGLERSVKLTGNEDYLRPSRILLVEKEKNKA